MGFEEKGDRGFLQRNGKSTLNCPVSELATFSVKDQFARMGMNSRSMFKSSNGVDPFFDSEWYPIVSMNQSGNFGVTENDFANLHSSFVAENLYTSDSVVVNMLPNNSSIGSGSFSEIVKSFEHIVEYGGHSTYEQNNGNAIRRASKSIADFEEHRQNIKDGVLGALPNGKRKRKVSLGTASSKNFEDNWQENPSGYTSGFLEEDDEKKLKFEQEIDANSDSKGNVKQAKDETISAELSKENYFHVRAKRGQATNSHSLAERVRRERISERMKLLQELVPGCNKITARAVMLDEIINYVQALQHQVEFLSMKLATVNPELSADMQWIFSKDILQSRGSNAIALGIGPGLSLIHPFPGFSPGNFQYCAPSPSPPLIHPLPQTLWNNDQLQGMLQMGFDSNHSVNSLGPNGL